MLRDYLISISRRLGTESSRNTQQRTVFIVRLEGVASGSNPEACIERTEENMASAVDVRPRSAVCVTANGMGQEIVPRTRRRTDSLKLLNKQAGSDAITVGLWSSWKKAVIIWLGEYHGLRQLQK
jgi:hypothetical protein